MIDNSEDETNFTPKLLLISRQVANLRKALLITHQQILNCQKLNYLR